MATPRPVVMRMLENPSNGEFVYAVVEQMRDDDVHGEVMRFRVHHHAAGTPRTATTSNAFLLDETGNQYDLRLSFVKFLLEKRDAGWKRTVLSLIHILLDGSDVPIEHVLVIVVFRLDDFVSYLESPSETLRRRFSGSRWVQRPLK